MLWKPLVAVVLLTSASAALGDEKGDALVNGWIARIPLLQPITAEFTITYRFAMLSTIYKYKESLAPDPIYANPRTYHFDYDFPRDLFNNPLAGNLNPLPYEGYTRSVGIGPKTDTAHTRYLGKETVANTAYDVVEVREILTHPISPDSRTLVSMKQTTDGRIPVKWYFDSEGVVRRISFSGLVEVPESYATIRMTFDPALKKAPQIGATSVPNPAAAPVHTERFTATMVVDRIRKSRTPSARDAMAEPLYTIPAPLGSTCAFSPDGQMLAVRNQEGIRLLVARTGRLKSALSNSAESGRMDFSPDGKSFAFAGAKGIRVVRTEDGGLIKSIATPATSIESLHFSSDGKRIAITSLRPTIEIYNVESGMLEAAIKGEGLAYEATFSANGKQLVTASWNSDLLVWDTATWQIIRRLPYHGGLELPLALSSDGKYIATVDNDNEVLIWDSSSDRPIKRFRGAVGHVTGLSFSSDRRTVFAVDYDDTSDIPTGSAGYVAWDFDSGAITANRSPWQNADGSPPARGVISPDGRMFAFSGSPFVSGGVAVYTLQRAE